MTDRGQAVDRMVASLEKDVEKSSMELVLSLLGALNVPTDKEGNLQLSPSQIALFNALWVKWAKKQAKLLKQVNDDLEELHDMVLDYYGQDNKVTQSSWVAGFIKTLGFGTMAAGTLGYALAMAEDAKNTIRQKMIYAMTTGKQNDLNKVLSDIPNELSRYYKGHLYDLHSQFERVASRQYAEELELTHAVYAGTAIETTRDFCNDRINKAYRIDQIKAWNNLQWKGKIPGVDVLIALGGYNCRHYLNYITENLYQKIQDGEV